MKKTIAIPTSQGLALFLCSKAKKSFQNLKNVLCKKLILQYFDIFKTIKLKIHVSEEAIREMLYQQNTNINLYIYENYLFK